MLRKIVLIVTAFIFVFSAAACGKDEWSDTADTSVVSLWLHKSESDDEGKVYRALVDTFNSEGHKTADGQKTLKIRLDFKGTEDTLNTAISSEILTGGLPDIIAIDAPNYAAYQNEGVIVPIDDYITQEQKSSYVDSVIAQATIGGKLYGLSGMDAPGGLYYNKSIITQSVLTAAGVSGYGTVDNPWSWNDVYKVLVQLRNNGASVEGSQIKLNLGFGGNEGNMYLYSSLVYSAGGSFHNNGVISGSLNSTASINGIKQLEKLTRKVGGNSYSYEGSNADAFAQGVIPLQIFGPWDISTIRKSYSGLNYDIMPMPVYESDSGTRGTIATPCGSWGFAVTSSSKKAADAAFVISYLTGKESSKMFYEGIGTFPTHKSLYDEISQFQTDGPLSSLADLLVDTAVTRPILVKYPQLRDAFAGIMDYVNTQVNESGYNLESWVSSKASQADSGN